MATNTAGKAGNWSDTTVWSLGHAPIAGEDVALGTYVIVWDTAQTTIPATGSLASISASTGGQITLALDDAAFHGGATITFTTAVAPALATTGLITVTGTTDHVLNINCTSVTGAGSGDYGIHWNTTGTLNFVGTLIGGSIAPALQVENKAATLNINGNITGGSGATSSAGVIFMGGTATMNISNSTLTAGSANAPAILNNGLSTVNFSNTGTGVNLVNTSTYVAYAGKTPTWNALATNYIQFGATKYAPEVAATDLKLNVKNGTVTGTLSASGGGSIAIF